MITILGLPSKHQNCEYCGKLDELRPYGKNGAKICFECGMKPENIKTTEDMCERALLGTSQVNKEQQN